MELYVGQMSWDPRPDLLDHPILRRWVRDSTYADYYKDNNDNVDPWADLGGARTQEHTADTESQEGDTNDWGYGSSVMEELD